MDSRARHQFFSSLFSYNDFLSFRNELVSAEFNKQKLTAVQLEKCYEAMRALFTHKPLCYVDVLVDIIDVVKRADTSVMKQAERDRLLTFIEKNIPWRFMFDAKNLYEHYGKINDDNENKEFPSRYRVYETPEQFAEALAVKKDDDCCDLDYRIHFMYAAMKSDLSEFVNYAKNYVKYSGKPVDASLSFEDEFYEFKDNCLLSVLAAMCVYKKATTAEEKIKAYTEVFGHLKTMVTYMHDFCCKVYGPEEFPRLPIMDMTPSFMNQPEPVRPSLGK